MVSNRARAVFYSALSDEDSQLIINLINATIFINGCKQYEACQAFGINPAKYATLKHEFKMFTQV